MVAMFTSCISFLWSAEQQSKLSYLLLLLNFYTAQVSEATKDIFQVKLGELETWIKTGQLETLSIVLSNDGALVSLT